jgi:hypothetical protein
LRVPKYAPVCQCRFCVVNIRRWFWWSCERAPLHPIADPRLAPPPPSPALVHVADLFPLPAPTPYKANFALVAAVGDGNSHPRLGALHLSSQAPGQTAMSGNLMSEVRGYALCGSTEHVLLSLEYFGWACSALALLRMHHKSAGCHLVHFRAGRGRGRGSGSIAIWVHVNGGGGCWNAGANVLCKG